jgi:hypothetical protein
MAGSVLKQAALSALPLALLVCLAFVAVAVTGALKVLMIWYLSGSQAGTRLWKISLRFSVRAVQTQRAGKGASSHGEAMRGGLPA